MTNYDRDKSIERLSKLWNFWTKTKWYLVGLLFVVMLVVFIKKDSFGDINMAIIIVIVIIAFIIILIFNDGNTIFDNLVNTKFNNN